MKRLLKKDGRRLFFERTTIGHPNCPIMRRTNIIRLKDGTSLRYHNFFPDADDRDVHDHPWWFVTLVVSGGYTDLVPCKICNGATGGCPWCGYHDVGLMIGDIMRRGSLRFRSANHKHRTLVNPEGCKTIVITGPVSRRWGFWHLGQWWPWRDYINFFGQGMRCDDKEADDERDAEVKAQDA